MRSAGVRIGADERASGQDGGVALGAQPGERVYERLGFDNAGVWREERRFRVHVRLAGLDERGVDERHAFDAVGLAPDPDRLQLRDPGVVVRDDQLAAAPVRDAVPCAELVE